MVVLCFTSDYFKGVTVVRMRLTEAALLPSQRVCELFGSSHRRKYLTDIWRQQLAHVPLTSRFICDFAFGQQGLGQTFSNNKLGKITCTFRLSARIECQDSQ